MKILFRWAINSAALVGIAYIVPGFDVDSIWIAILAALVLGLVNALVRPILVVLTLPITVLTLGLFLIVINALMLWLAASIIPGFDIASFYVAMFGALILWVVSMATNWLIKN
ncbi:phage holin family protein [Candidatus Uhrbacteria bacterium]|nr:phage holin family protein [Candidatus Uhrbacteria bacterium]